MTQPAIDLTRHHFRRDLGEFSLYGTWLYNDDQEDTEPCMVIVPRYRNGAIPCCIALSAAFRYNDPRYAVHMARGYAEKLGFADSMTRTHTIASLIYDNLPDLLSMPNDPTETLVVGEAKIDVGNGRKTSIELLDYEQMRQY